MTDVSYECADTFTILAIAAVCLYFEFKCQLFVYILNVVKDTYYDFKLQNKYYWEV